MFDIFISDRAELGGGPFAIVNHDKRDDLPPSPDGGTWRYVATVDGNEFTSARVGLKDLAALKEEGFLISGRPLF